MLTSLLQGCSQPNQLVFLLSCSGDYCFNFRFAFRQRTGFVDNQGVYFFQNLKRLRIPNENAGLSAPPSANHNGNGCRQSQRARAGNDQHRHSVHQCVGQPRLGSQNGPRNEGHNRNRNHRRDKPCRDSICQTLNRRAAALRLTDQLHNLCQ